MLDLVKFELYKIVSKPIVKITAIILLIYMLFVPISTYVMNRITYGDDLSNIATKYEEGKYSVEDLERDVESIDKKDKEELKKEENFINYELRITYPQKSQFKYDVLGRRYSKDDIVAKVKAMDLEGKSNTYEYKEFKKAEGMISKLNIPEYKYTGDWRTINNGLMIGAIILVMIILGLSTIFNEDFTDRSAAVILSSKLGKTILPISKVIAGVLYSIGIWIITTGTFLLNGVLNGFNGWNLPLNHLYKGSPYNMTIIEMYLVSIILVLIGTVVFSLIVMLLSLTIRSSMVTLGAGICIYSIPKLLMLVDSSEGILNYLRYINPTNLLEALFLFKYYDVVNIFGEPILVPIALIVMAIILGIGCSYAIIWKGKRQLL